MAFYVMQSVWFAGLHKIQAGWLYGYPLNRLLAIEPDIMVRAYAQAWMVDWPSEAVAALAVAVVVTQLVAPVLCLDARTRPWALLWLATFFASLGAVIVAPPVFLLSYGGGLLALSQYTEWRGMLRGRTEHRQLPAMDTEPCLVDRIDLGESSACEP